ncbi:telomere stability and silencing domain-containing protein [Phthorimaea operculella]|nr:telomere stability and silencing domain-containing protein [Phthorimaea operculella]
MPFQVYFEDHFAANIESHDVASLKHKISHQYGVAIEDLYVTINGKIFGDDYVLKTEENVVRVCTKLVGGKGGFGSMLRAIGAQIEKTTNREACRDLSGRRLRDINEEKRLRKWLEGQEDREREALERKQKKIERILAEPKIEVNLNPSYERERQELPERSGVWRLLLLLAFLVLVAARPQEFDDEEEHDQSEEKKDDVGRVQIKVYRGPTKHDGYAPWGFWVKQPSDED